MELIVVDVPEASRYEIRHGERRVGLVQYRRAPGRISFTHTETDPTVQGRGVGSVLIGRVLDEARAAGLEVLPFCPFVRRFMRAHTEYVELVPADRRGAFGLGG